MKVRRMFGHGACACVALGLALGGPASAPAGGCGPFTTDLVTGFRLGGDAQLRGTQDTDSGWTYRIGGVEGPLMVGLGPFSGGLAGYWGSPQFAFTTPFAGPVYSPDPQLNQVTFFRRAPSFTGLFLHPGEVDAQNAAAILTVQAPIVITSLSGQVEDLGGFDGLQARVFKRVGGVETDVVAFTFAGPSPAPAVALTPTPGSLPFSLGVGDRLVVQSNRFGNQFEDWCNVNVAFTFEGGPLVPAPATVTRACFGRSAVLRVAALGSGLSYQWRRNGVPMSDVPGKYAGTGASDLTISNLIKLDTLDVFDCVVTSSCTGFSVLSGAGRVTNLLPDLNSDGFINTADLTAFLGRFGQPISPDHPADINSDGAVNTSDLTAFLGAFGQPCPGG